MKIPLVEAESFHADRITDRYHSLNAVVAQSKNYPFRVNATTELKNITTYDNKDI